jgi:Zinc carboxypeptidase
MFSRFRPGTEPARLLILTLLSLLPCFAAAVPTPREHFGFTPGDEKKLANYEELIGYFQKLAANSDRIRLERFGTTSTGKPMYIAFLSSPDNLRKLSRYREISRRLALGIPEPEEARRLTEQGKAIVWIDSGLHASEVAPSQQAPELAYRMITEDSEETRGIRQNVILLQVPCINPDGLDWVVEWYRQNVGTPYELAPLPRLYQKYSGHDNNRDWFMLNLPESRNVTRLLFQEWFPQIVYNQHQAPPFPARIFVPPYSEPLNPNIPAAVMDGINQIGAAMRERFARSNQPGVLSYWGYDAWWNGGLRSVPAFHNMHGILTETAGFLYGNSHVYKPGDFPERFGNGMPTREATIFYDRPWLGGQWGVREAIDYMLTADFAILELASARSAHFLYKAYELARANIAANPQVAYIIPREQWDRSAAESMLERVHAAGIRVERAATSFQANGKTYPEGTRIIRAGQPFRGYVIDLFEPQRYPELRSGTSGPTKRPYDIAGWTFSMLMGTEVDRVEGPLNVHLEDDSLFREDAEPSNDHRDTGFFLAMAKAAGEHRTVRWSKDGRLLEPGQTDYSEGAFEFPGPPRVAVYEPWTANIDTGWTDWLLDHFHVPHTMIHNQDLRTGGLRARFDTVMLASQSAASILHGIRSGERAPGRPGEEVPVEQRPEFSGGIELAGLAELDSFVRGGGTLVAFDAATELPVQQFPLPLRLLLRPPAEGRDGETDSGAFYCPGSILRITVDSQEPMAFGMPKEAFAFSTGGQAFDITLLPEFNKGDREVRVIARYASSNLLASGWLSGERAVLGRPILVEARHGQGRVLLFGFRPQFRGQTFGDFKFVLNAVYLGSARRL